MTSFLSSDIKYLKGVGEKLGKQLNADLQIRTFRDLLYYFPSRFIDRSRFFSIAEFNAEMPYVQVQGSFMRLVVEGEGAKRRLAGLFSDGVNNMEVVWFSRITAISNSLRIGVPYVLFGKPTRFNGHWSMAHPEISSPESVKEQSPFYAVYPLSEKARKHNFTAKSLRRLVNNIFQLPRFSGIAETLPAFIREQMQLMPLAEALSTCHFPASPQVLEAARYRFKFEELYYIQLHLLRFSRQRRRDIHGQVFPKVGDCFNTFYRQILPFDLTDAQKRVIKEIRGDMLTGKQMNRLLQGDVGSGKTLVAFLTTLLAVDNGAQAAIMAPTEILATQHYNTLRSWCVRLGVNIGLLTGSTPKKERRFIDEALRDGSMQILVGTHALIEDTVKFKNLGVAIIDEQHRFGVAQRARMWSKNTTAPHMLVMTATPIPRTLAMTLYGDLDVSVIDQLPPGRKPITTRLYYQEKKEEVWRLVASRLRLGQQAYVVYPLIKENEKIDLRSVEEGYRTVQQIFGAKYRIAYVHGQMKPAEKDYQMQLFASGEAQVLVATTVIEVGVNVPNATVMVIDGAERFGLSQLHQLRGRVGRGADMSFCALVAKYKMSADTRRRLELMTQTTDGFEIAEADMKMRGPGDIEGTMQSGLPFNLRMASLAKDSDILTLARQKAAETLDRYPQLSDKTQPPQHSDKDLSTILAELDYRFGHSIDWSAIS